MPTIFHADDFGITVEQSKTILSCSSICGGTGALNSTSVLVNSPAFDECAALLDPFEQTLHIGVHINLVEGRCVADPDDVPLLVDDAGMFRNSFAGLLAASAGDKADALRDQLQVEISAQIRVFIERFPHAQQALRIDSHQHFHMIPAVFDAVRAAAAYNDCTVEYLRIPAEPTRPFTDTPAGLVRIPAINWVKHGLLNRLWRSDRRTMPADFVPTVFCGINFSGRMTYENVALIKPAFERYARLHDTNLELLFHPGGYSSIDDALNPNLDGFVRFYRDENRAREADALRRLV